MGQDLRAAAVGALIPLGCGLFVLDGYALGGWFGAFFCLMVDVIWLIWWRSKHWQWFPRELGWSHVVWGVFAVMVFGFVLLGAI